MNDFASCYIIYDGLAGSAGIIICTIKPTLPMVEKPTYVTHTELRYSCKVATIIPHMKTAVFVPFGVAYMVYPIREYVHDVRYYLDIFIFEFMRQ